jgi:ubiquinone/menaquinone biosynthesis C-methylase UbiE
MLPYLSRAVGPKGKVIGEDIAADFLDRARAKASADKIANTDLVLGTETDPKLPTAAVDVALVLDVYHHFDYPAKMLANISQGLKPHGRFVVVDFYRKDRPDHVRLDRDDVRKEIESNGFHFVSMQERTGNNQYMLIFEKP